MSFDSLGEAYDFYNLYSWELGFGIRYGKSRLNAERTKSMQEIVCGCSVSFFIIIYVYAGTYNSYFLSACVVAKKLLNFVVDHFAGKSWGGEHKVLSLQVPCSNKADTSGGKCVVNSIEYIKSQPLAFS